MTTPRIVVIVGTDHHPFDRLIGWVNDWLDQHPAAMESAFVQSGSAAIPPRCAGSEFLQIDQLDKLLRTSIESLDISNEEYQLAVSRYETVGSSLADYWGDAPDGGEVYPQGSMRLGTVTRNIHRVEVESDSARFSMRASSPCKGMV